MNILIDNNLPIWWSERLRGDGFDAKHVIECALDAATDDEIRERFRSSEIVLISRDADFWKDTPARWSLIWVNVHNPKIADLSTWLYDNMKRIAGKASPGTRHILTENEVISLPPS